MRKRKEYAAYRGETMLHIGTKGQLANALHVSASTITFYLSPSYRKRAESGNIDKRIIVVRLDDDDDDQLEEKNMNKNVQAKWQTDGDLAVIYRIENILAFYRKELDPDFKNNQSVSLDEVQSTQPYKTIAYAQQNIPSDACPDLAFTWSSATPLN